MNQSQNRRKASGFTIIELMVVIAIIGLIIAGIIARRASVSQTASVQQETSNLQAIAGKVASTFAGRPNYTGATTAFLLAQGAFPNSMVNGATVVNSWNGAVTVAPAAGNTTLDITYAGVPTSACIELVAAVSRNYNEVTVGATATKAGAAVSDLTVTQTACSAAATASVKFNSN